MDQQTINKILAQSAEFFETDKDPSQIPATMETVEKLQALHPGTIVYREDGHGNYIGHVSLLPTNIPLMCRFLRNEITEHELLLQSVPQERYEAIYIIATLVDPKYQHEGFATDMLVEAIQSIPVTQQRPFLFYWPVTEAGDKLVRHVGQLLGLPTLKKLQSEF